MAESKEPVDLANEEAGYWLEERLTTWLRKEDWNIEELVALLEGCGISVTPLEEEPYLALLEALPAGAERFAAETEMACRAAALLDRRPDERQIGDPPERLLYNLLMLCAGLASPDQLTEALYAMWRRKLLQGEWAGIDLRYALTTALTSNQLDSRMAPEWNAMLQGHPGEFLLGHEYDGFEGLLWMPESLEKRGEPFLDSIGKGLRDVALYLEKSYERRPEFRSFIQRVKETYPDRSSWDEDLIFLADRHQLPKWAVGCLPSLFCLTTEGAGGPLRRVLVWWVLLPFLERGERGWKRLRSLCDGNIVEVEIEEDFFLWTYEKIARPVEERRRTFPFPSEDGLLGAVSDRLAELELELSDGAAQETLEKGKRELVSDKPLEKKVDAEESQPSLRTILKKEPNVALKEGRAEVLKSHDVGVLTEAT